MSFKDNDQGREEVAVSGIKYTRTATLESDEEEIEFVTTSRSSDPSSMKDHQDPTEYYTVEDAVEQIGFGPFQIIVTIFAGMCWVWSSYCRHTSEGEGLIRVMQELSHARLG